MSVYTFLRKIPMFGTMLFIANTYVYNGDFKSESELAGPVYWWRAMGSSLILASLLSAGTLWPMTEGVLFSGRLCTSGLSDFLLKPGTLLISVIPNLLGFGIGVYALVFALGTSFVREVHNSIEKKRSNVANNGGSVLMLNSDLAYPLMILVVALAVGILQQAFDSSTSLVIVAWVTVWYALMVTLEVIAVLFRLGEHSLLDKSMKAPAKGDDDLN